MNTISMSSRAPVTTPFTSPIARAQMLAAIRLKTPSLILAMVAVYLASMIVVAIAGLILLASLDAAHARNIGSGNRVTAASVTSTPLAIRHAMHRCVHLQPKTQAAVKTALLTA
jgi:hypothetical protein